MHKHHLRCNTLTLALLIAAGIAIAPAHAQNTSSQSTVASTATNSPAVEKSTSKQKKTKRQRKKKGSNIEEVLVSGIQVNTAESKGTALFGAGDLRDVPFSVSVVTEDDMANRQITNLAEALAYDPAVTPSYGGTGAYQDVALNVRGFELRDNSNTLLDGAPMYGAAILGVEDLERVEVLRGTAAFRAGFVSPGGIINLVRKRPTDEQLLSLNTSYDSWGMLTTHLDAGDRAGENDAFGYRINVLKAKGDWFVGDIEQDRNFFSGTFDYRFSDDTVATVTLNQNAIDMDGDMFHWTSLDTNGQLHENIDPELDWGQPWAFSDVKTSSALFNLESQLTESTHFSLTAMYTENDNDQSYTTPGTSQPDGTFPVNHSRFAFDVQAPSLTAFFTSEFNTGAISHNLSYGGSWAEYELNNYSGAINNFATNNFYNPVVLPYSGAYVPDEPGYVSDNTQYGVFVSDQMSFSERWHALVGLRYSDLDRINTRNTVVNNAITASSVTQQSNDAITPMLALMYDINSDIRLYSSYSEGLEVGGRAPLTTNNPNAQMDARDSVQFELGVKANLFNDSMTLDAAIFDINRTLEYTNAANYYVQDGEQRHRGFEAGLKGMLFDSLELGVGFQYLDAEIVDTNDVRLIGTRPTGVPELTGSINGDYAFQSVEGLYMTLGVIYVGDRVAGADPVLRDIMDSYLRVDTSIRYETGVASKDVILRLGIENLLNENYFSASYYNIQEPGVPRSITASAEIHF